VKAELYNSYKRDAMDGDISLSRDTIKVLLVTADYVFDRRAHRRRADIKGEATGQGYESGGLTLKNKRVVQDNVGDQGVFFADGVYWPGSFIRAVGSILYKSRGDAAKDELIAWLPAEERYSQGGDFSLTWDEAGIVGLT
jgi:hypothetical protein